MPGGKIFVEKYEILDQIVEASITSPRKTHRIKSLSTSTQETIFEEAVRRSKVASESNRKLLIEQKKAESQRIDAVTRSNVQKSIKKNIEKDEKRFHVLKEDVESARNFLRSIDKTLQMQDEANRNKVRRQFDDWNGAVHGQIQGNISSQVNAMDYKEINARRNRDMQEYLDVTNRKAAIFRDIIIESEYDPLEPNRRSVKAVTGKLKNPTNISLQKREEELSMLAPAGQEHGFASRSRYTLPVEHWSSGKIEATPHGKFAQMMDASRRAKTTTAPATFQSTIHFDDYNVPRGKTVIDEEMPRGKKVFPALSATAMKSIVNYDEARVRQRVVTGSNLHLHG